ncbi:MAG: hypothetical protein LHW44_00310 [Candidatus Cloacimonetes bacterium]|nr:hypothetical protein [Candidatus Cloacimonadota bacterium]
MTEKKEDQKDYTDNIIAMLEEAYENTDKGDFYFFDVIKTFINLVNMFGRSINTNIADAPFFIRPKPFVECVNKLLHRFLNRSKENDTHKIIGGNLKQIFLLEDLVKLLKEWNEKQADKVDLDLLNSIIELHDQHGLYSIVKSAKECVDYIESSNEDYLNEVDIYDMDHVFASARGLYHCLLGDINFAYYDPIRPDYTQLLLNLTAVENAETCYELWSLFSFDDFRVYMDFSTDIELPKVLKIEKINSNKCDNSNVYAAKLHIYHQNIEDFKTIKDYLENNRQQIDNDHDIAVIIKRIDTLVSIISYLIKKTMEEKELIETNAKLEERNRILAKLSHSIKNMLKAVIDPLINLREELPQKAVVIDNAIKGANLIREIVNAINLSFQTTLEDLEWDVSNPCTESMTLQDMIIDSLRFSISNMFDTRYFPAYSEQFFPRSLDNVAYTKIKQEWNEVSAGSASQIADFLEKYMFHLELNLDESGQYHVGNEKSSAIKLLILFQEIIFNAVKYSSYVPFANRELNITLTTHEVNLKLLVKNSFDPNVRAKTTGVGTLVIENFANILGCSPIITKTDTMYLISLEFKNLWRSDG